MQSLAGKVAFVTVAKTGIGLGITKRLEFEGAGVLPYPGMCAASAQAHKPGRTCRLTLLAFV
jgi:NAD(P)-dependent dehydrogenase (short-subunit alcohol dehydrogenase family)